MDDSLPGPETEKPKLEDGKSEASISVKNGNTPLEFVNPPEEDPVVTSEELLLLDNELANTFHC